MFRRRSFVLLSLCAVFYACRCQDFAAEMTRQCLVPDPVGLVDCVEAKVTLPYLTSWVECTNSLGQNVRTSADVVHYRCKSVWEGKALIPEVFYIKDCVIEKTGLPAKNVSAEVLGAYKECESTPSTPQQRIKGGGPVQQQPITASRVEYNPPTQQIQPSIVRPPQQPVQQIPVAPVQQVRTPVPFQPQNVAPRQPFQAPAVRPFQPQQPFTVQRPVQQQFQGPVFRPVQQAPAVPARAPAQQARPVQFTQQRVPASFGPQSPPGVSRPQYPAQTPRTQYPTSVNPASQRQPVSQQFFTIYPQPPLPNQQQQQPRVGNPVLSQKTAAPAFSQQQILASAPQVTSILPTGPYSYAFQVSHPLRAAF